MKVVMFNSTYTIMSQMQHLMLLKFSGSSKSLKKNSVVVSESSILS